MELHTRASSASIERLRDFLRQQQPGALPSAELVPLPEPCWDEIQGTDVHKTYALKISGMEDAVWHPPLLRFILARHGATVNGSSRAALHRWTVNVDPPARPATPADIASSGR
jgi:hypothetical protein